MQILMSRYGGHSVIFGKGKASDEDLPKDQSSENMLDNYAKEIIPNYSYISSYDAIPEWMGSIVWNTFPKRPVKLGTLSHQFLEILAQNDIRVTTDIYLTYHRWSNVYAIIVKTHKETLKYEIADYEETYDYVLQVCIESKNDIVLLKNRPKDIERILWILFYKMELIYEDCIQSFTPSKTFLGKLISDEFVDTVGSSLIDIDNDEKLALLLNKPPNYI